MNPTETPRTTQEMHCLKCNYAWTAFLWPDQKAPDVCPHCGTPRRMKRWKGTVVVAYTQEIEVEAETQAEAEATMLDWFEPSRCTNTAEGQVYDIKEVTQ